MNLTGFEMEKVGDVEVASRVDANGVVLEKGSLKNGIKQGTWTTFYPNGEPQLVMSYVDGKKQGMAIGFDKNGRVNRISHFANDKFHGRHREFVSYNPTRETYFKDGEFDGIHKEYDEYGKLQRTTQFKKGKQDGEMNYYNPEGKITATFLYRNGEKVEGGINK